MKIKFKTRMIVVNILIAMVAIALICLVVTQGIWYYSLNNYVNNLRITANEASLMISQSMRSTQLSDQDALLYRVGGPFFAEEIAKVYSLGVMLYDEEMNLVGGSLEEAADSPYKTYAGQVFSSGRQAYIYTEIANVNHVILFSPVVINGNTVGAMALFTTTTQLDRTIQQTIRLFIMAGAIMGAFSALFYTYASNRMLRPVNQLVEYTRAAALGDTFLPLDIPYNGEDEIQELIESCSLMVCQINNKIEELQFEKEKLSAVISSMQDAVIAVNLSNEILTTNRKLNEYFSNASDYLAIIPHIDETIRKVLATRENVSTEFSYENRNFLMSGSLIASGSREGGVLLVIKDVTALKKIEEEQNKFISTVSHELKTPLTTIIGYIDLLQRRGTDDPQLTAKALATTKKETQRLLRLVNDLLNINRYHSIDFDFIFTNIDPNALIEEAVSEMNVRGNQNEIAVVYSPIQLPEVRGDYDRLKQVLINVIDNAIKYSHPDDIVKVTATFDEANLEITVRDFGDGIPEDMQEKVFDTFYRVEEDRSRLRGGFGLGLSIVKNIIQKHSGEVKIESVPGQGTLVVITLPLLLPQEKEMEHE